VAFTVTILGSSSALPTSNRNTSAHLLNVDERLFLIDCGEGTQIQMRRFKARMGRLNHIFISHLHGDHTFGLPGLISSLILLEKCNDLHIYGHKELKNLLGPYIRFYLHDMSFNLVFHELNTSAYSLIYEDKKMTVHSFPLKHRIDCCGFIFKEKIKERNVIKEAITNYNLGIKDIVALKNGADFITPSGEIIPNHYLTIPPFKPRSYVYCSDTLYMPSIVPYIENVDLLYHEATFLNDELKRANATYHSTSLQAAMIAKQAQVGKLLLGHFSARYKDVSPLLKEASAIFPNTITVNDGDKFEVIQQRMPE
jgi:ribonuclease Z